MNLDFDNVLQKVEKVLSLITDKEGNLSSSFPTSIRYYDIVQRIYSILDEHYIQEMKIRETYSLSKNAQRRSNQRLRKLESRKQRCLRLL